ncbi:MAG: CapA family protein [Anaerolineales bacterium]|nr:CapA family protein [Anaerolineales bacterium]
MSSPSIVPAVQLANNVPEDLSALRYIWRPPVAPGMRLLAVGDVGFSGRVLRSGQINNFRSLFRDVVPFLTIGDFVFGNLETPLVDQAADYGLFAGTKAAVPTLSQSGFHLLHLANNHIYDYGAEGLFSSLQTLSAGGLAVLGAGDSDYAARQAFCVDIGPLKMGWLGCGRTKQIQTEGGPKFWEFDQTELIGAIQKLRPTVDFLVVSIHIGLMYLDYPDPEHREMAKALTAAGADLVLMHHAHVLQGVEVQPEGQIICHNLGNFLLDWQEGHVSADIAVQEQREGGVFVFDIDQEGIYQMAVLPTWIKDDCTVTWAVAEQGERILSRLMRISQDLKGDYTAVFKQQRAERNIGLTFKVIGYHVRQGNYKVFWQSLQQLRPKHLNLIWRWLNQKRRTPIS